ncbi:MAG: ParA family protein [Porphyromonas sp.]|nr:ParA family protein [Porphyromonas sp.]
MEKIRIALAGLKGGIGKTTLSMVLGSILQETYKKRVCYVDCDYFQYPITAQRQREQIFFERYPELAEELFSQRNVVFADRLRPTIHKMNEGFERDTFPEVVESEYPDFDVYIYDFMGSQGYEDTYRYLTKMDFIILPTVIDTVTSKPTYYWMNGVAFAKEMATKLNEEVRNKGIYLLFNNFNDEACDFELKAWLEDQASKFGVKVLQNMVRRYSGVARDISCVTEDDLDFFISLSLQPSANYSEMTHILQVADEFFLDAGIIRPGEEQSAPRVIDDPFALHSNIVEDLKEQLKELEELTDRVNGGMSELSTKHQDLLKLYQKMCSLTVEEIKEYFGRKVYNPADSDEELSDTPQTPESTDDTPSVEEPLNTNGDEDN